MKADEAIRISYENEVSELNLSDDTWDKMLNYIEEQGEVKNKRGMLNRLREFASKIPVVDYVGVAAFILILIFIPYGVKHYNLKKGQAEDSIAEQKLKNSFVNEIEKVIEDRHAYNSICERPRVTDEKSYTDIKEIKEKAPFAIDYPKFLPEGYILANTELRIITFEFKGGITDQSPSVTINYKDNKGNEVAITEDKSECPNGVNEPTYISLDGIDGWFYGSETKNTVEFWTKDRMYSIVASSAIDKDTIIKIAKSFNVFSNRKLWLTDKHEVYTGVEEIKSKLPFTVEKPKFYPKDCREGSEFLDITKNSKGALYEFNIYYIGAQYDGNQNTSPQRYFAIRVINEASKPEEILKKCEKTTLGKLEAWIYPSENGKGNNQVMFWKKGLYYNIASSKLDVDTLKKIAESFND